jgi:hypothetical protein
MSTRVSRSLALSLVVLAGAGCTDSAEVPNVAPFTRAVFDPDVPSIPTPNDLALQAAPSVTDPTTRGALFALIDLGGFVANPATPGIGALSVINVPYERVTAGIGSAPAVALDAATVTGTTVAIVRVSGAGAPEVIAPAVVQNVPGFLRMLPATGYTAGTRYVVAVRGGPNGVKTADGEMLVASTPMALVRDPTVDFTDPDSRPASLSDAQAADLATLRLALTAPLNWMRVASDAICRAALGIPAGAPFPEARCWLPDTAGDPGVLPAFNAVELVFPVAEAISIQTFEIAP